jgi:NDP-sugar pyrophosphorylase family protein
MNEMQIVIPMSGFGERFRQAGYDIPKPLIEIDGKPMIAYVIEMFPGETDMTFICNQDHLAEPAYRMEALILKHCPQARIVGIPSHKLGPVHAVQQVAHLLDHARPVLVSYCDYTCYWLWEDFKAFVRETGCDGAIPAYRGFHPHSLGTTNYAYLREKDGWALDIKEKEPFTSNRMQEFASSGAYYFATGALMLETFDRQVGLGLHLKGEYYLSLACKLLMTEGRAVAIYELQHFMQWGTPQDVAEYRNWSATFDLLVSSDTMISVPRGAIILPMAGMGKRFIDEGYGAAKPLIPVSGRPMVLQATSDLPLASAHVFVLRSDMPDHDEIVGELRTQYPSAIIVSIDRVTEGQACTALLGLNAMEAAGIQGPLTVGACDCGLIFDQVAFDEAMADADVVVWAVRGHADAVRRPAMYGWIAETSGVIERMSVKQPLESPQTDPVVTGVFTFRRPTDLRVAIESLINRNGRVNGEFYLDSCIDDCLSLGLKCKVFEVKSWLCWGTPNDLRTFEYWQSCFHKWQGHAYRLELDVRVPLGAQQVLVEKNADMRPSRPKSRRPEL